MSTLRDLLDLYAQMEMAKYAKWTVVLGGLSLIASAAALYFARRAFLQSVEANRILREDGRPWVGVNLQVRDGVSHDEDLGIVRIRFICSLVNSGRAAAQDVEVETHCAVRAYGEKFNGGANYHPLREGQQRYVVMAGLPLEDLHVVFKLPQTDIVDAAGRSNTNQFIPSISIRVTYSIPGDLTRKGHCVTTFSVWRRARAGLPALAVKNGLIPALDASELYVANEGGTAG